jgi:hypothetical protein
LVIIPQSLRPASTNPDSSLWRKKSTPKVRRVQYCTLTLTLIFFADNSVAKSLAEGLHSSCVPAKTESLRFVIETMP